MTTTKTDTDTHTPTVLQTHINLELAVDKCFSGAMLIATEADIVMLKRNYAPHGEDRYYAVTHSILACGEYSFYWSTYDLTLEEAAGVYCSKVASSRVR